MDRFPSLGESGKMDKDLTFAKYTDYLSWKWATYQSVTGDNSFLEFFVLGQFLAEDEWSRAKQLATDLGLALA